MNKQRMIGKLRARRHDLEALGVKSLHLFGSRAKGTANTGSDVDLFLDFVPGRFDLFDLVAVRDMLAEDMPMGVDITTRGSLHPRLRADIERNAVRVF